MPKDGGHGASAFAHPTGLRFARNDFTFLRRVSAFSRRNSVRAVDRNSPSSDERAQGMPDAGRTHGPPAIRKAGGSYHRFSRNNRHSLRDVLRLIARPPRGPGFLAPVARKLRKLANLASASGGQDHTPSPSAPTMLVLHHHRVHRIPPHDRDDAFAPLAEAGRRYDNHNITKNGRKIFFGKWLDRNSANPHVGQITSGQVIDFGAEFRWQPLNSSKKPQTRHHVAISWFPVC